MLELFARCVTFQAFCRLLTFFQNYYSQKTLLRNTIRVPNGWDPDQDIRANVLSVLIWVQIACKCYQQTTKVATSLKRVNHCPFENKIHIIYFTYFLFFNQFISNIMYDHVNRYSRKRVDPDQLASEEAN